MPPPKRQPKMTTQTLLSIDLEDESSSDSDFRIEDHNDNSDDDFSGNSGAESDQNNEDSDDSGSDDDSEDEKPIASPHKSPAKESKPLREVLEKANNGSLAKTKEKTIPICAVCLGDRSDDTNEIVECDNCGVSVHELCYGVSDSNSVSSTTSSCSTEPWFCEACRAKVKNPICELCPNKGGIFKETDVGKWVHLVCALYIPGVAFGEVDQLSSVTVFEMPYSKWGCKTCSLCEHEKYARTGVCIGCDAGMCKTYFHVTCAQAAGFLTEAHSDEADHADPFYAHCKVHSDKTLMKNRKRNYQMFCCRMQQKKLDKQDRENEEQTPGELRIQRKLNKYYSKYQVSKANKKEPWVPTQKISRFITTSCRALDRFAAKAKVMEIDVEAREQQEAHIAAISDIRKKWHVQPALSVEFVAYYLDRMTRLRELKTTLENNIELNSTLLSTQQKVREEYENESRKNLDLKTTNESLQNSIKELHKQIEALCPGRSLPKVESLTVKPVKVQPKEPQIQPPPSIPAPSRPMSVPTAAALKMGVGFPLQHLPGSTIKDSGKILSTQSKLKNDLLHECGICKLCNNQHLLVKCDTCSFHYHLGCLNPPLTRHPKKSKLYGWQCSECDKSDDSDNPVELAAKRQRKVRKFSKDGSFIILSDSSDSEKKKFEKKSEVVSLNGVVVSPRPLSSLSLSSRKSVGVKSPTSEVLNLSIHAKTPPVQNHFSALAQPAKDKCNNSVKVLVENSNTTNFQSPASPLNNHLNNHTFPDPENSTNDISAADVSSVTENGEILNMNGKGRKKRKEKHRNKEHSFDSEISPSKERKRKRKKKNAGDEHGSHEGSAETTSAATPGHQIKVKFKPFPALPGEDAPEPHFFYVSADSVRADTSRPTSVETVEDSNTIYDDNSARSALSPIMMTMLKENTYRISSSPHRPHNHVSSTQNSQNTPSRKSPIKSSTPKEKPSPKKQPNTNPNPPKISPQKFIPARRLSRLNSTIPKAIRQMLPKITAAKSLNKSIESVNITCDVCRLSGTHQNIVMCDECKKNYHLGCLDPPLTKTPKRRGYSWHCADCDPTDTEN